MRYVDYGLVSALADRYGLRDAHPTESWVVMQLLEKTHQQASERDKRRLEDSHSWYFNKRKTSPQPELPLWSSELDED